MLGRLSPDFKIIADFRKDNGAGIRQVCRLFIDLCRQLKLFTDAVVAIDGSKFNAVNSRENNFTKAKMAKRREQTEASITRYLSELDEQDKQDIQRPQRKKELDTRIKQLKQQVKKLQAIEQQRLVAPDKQVSLTNPDARSMTSGADGKALVGYNVHTAVDTKHHLVVHHEISTKESGREQLSSVATGARDAIKPERPMTLQALRHLVKHF